MTLERLFVETVGTNPVVQALVGGVVIAAFNTLGALLVLVWPNPSDQALDTALGFAAGVMLSASFTSLILPGIEFASAPAYDAVSVVGFELVGIVPVIVGFALGVVLLDRADQWVPHVHVVITGKTRVEEDTPGGRERVAEQDARVASLLLFIVAITIHNLPEGLAVGVSFGSGNLGDALALMLAIGAQNVPEGLAVSIAAVNAGMGSLFYATIAGVRAGLVEIPVAVVGAVAIGLAAPILPYAMGFAAGAMLFVISDEIVPETHARGHERLATLGTMVGVVVMLYLDVTLA